MPATTLIINYQNNAPFRTSIPYRSYRGGTFAFGPCEIYPTGTKYNEYIDVKPHNSNTILSKERITNLDKANKISVLGYDREYTVLLITGMADNPIELRPSDYRDMDPRIWFTGIVYLPESIALNKTSLTLSVGASEGLTASVSPASADQHVAWSSNNEAVATVTAEGVVTAVSTGTAEITATSTAEDLPDDVTVSASCTVTVTGAPAPAVESVSVTPSALSLAEGMMGNLAVSVTPAGASQSVIWTSANEAVATVSGGKVTAVKAGTAEITATSAADSSKSASCTVTVTAQSRPKPETPVVDPAVDVPANVDTAKQPEEFSGVNEAAEALSSDITAGDLEISDGAVFIKGAKADEIIKASLENESLDKIQPLPLFSVNTGKEIAAAAWKLKGAALLADTFDKVDVRKIVSGTEVLKFEYKTSGFTDGSFTILDMEGKLAAGAVTAENDYQLLLFIADNGSYDLDKTAGVVTDPAVIIKTTATPEPASGGSSGGCAAGVGAFALIALCPLIFRKRSR